jgi:hypothetical protein
MPRGANIRHKSVVQNGLFAAINILGLGIGIAAVVWAYQTYRFSFSFDDFHPDREHIFRALVYRDGMEGAKGLCPSPVALAAKQDFASIAEVVRWDSRGADIKGEQIEPFSGQVHFTDPAFFEFFNFPLVAGSNDLSDKNAVLLSEEMATKFFGKENPLGKTLVLYTGEKISLPLTVKGVLKDPPLNSSIGRHTRPIDATNVAGMCGHRSGGYRPVHVVQPLVAADFQQYV